MMERIKMNIHMLMYARSWRGVWSVNSGLTTVGMGVVSPPWGGCGLNAMGRVWSHHHGEGVVSPPWGGRGLTTAFDIVVT